MFRMVRADGVRVLRSRTTISLLLVAALNVGCSRAREGEQSSVTLAGLDSALSELGGIPTAVLERGQRWRMIASTGSGLPPTSFKPEDLPEPRSRGAGLLQVYCVQCHWLPTPQMHTAAEWPRLMRRMLLRARTLKNRLGGPLTRELVGEVLMAGLETAELPSEADVDTMLAYLQRHALIAAAPEEIAAGPGYEMFIEQCSLCHDTPSPKAHTAAGWEPVVAQMRANMSMMGVEPLTDEQSDSIVAYLRSRAAP